MISSAPMGLEIPSASCRMPPEVPRCYSSQMPAHVAIKMRSIASGPPPHGHFVIGLLAGSPLDGYLDRAVELVELVARARVRPIGAWKRARGQFVGGPTAFVFGSPPEAALTRTWSPIGRTLCGALERRD